MNRVPELAEGKKMTPTLYSPPSSLAKKRRGESAMPAPFDRLRDQKYMAEIH
jgi:hypothetical protein